MDDQSSLASLLAAKALRLRPSRTLVTRADGSCHLEARDPFGTFTTVSPDNYEGVAICHGASSATGSVTGNQVNTRKNLTGFDSSNPGSFTSLQTHPLSAACPGFVVDTKPDLRCSLILPHLLLAGQDVAHDDNILAQFGVTDVLSLVPPEAGVGDAWWALSDHGELVKHSQASQLSEMYSSETDASLKEDTAKQKDIPTAGCTKVTDAYQQSYTGVEKTELRFSAEGDGTSVPGVCRGGHVPSRSSRSSSSSRSMDETVPQLPGTLDVTHAVVEQKTTPGTVRRVYCSMLDAPEFRIHSSLTRCIEFINKVRNDGGVVLVHCNAGVSRAPTVVVAYCMRQMGYTYDQAFDFVKQKRNFIRPNDGFVKQLRSFEEFLHCS